MRVCRYDLSYGSSQNSPNNSQSNFTSFVLKTNVNLLDSSSKTSFSFFIISLDKAAAFFFNKPDQSRT